MIDTDTLVVGAGPQALTVVARWLDRRPASVNNLVVADPAGTWLHAWEQAFAQQQIEVLRSPGVHHPDPDDMALVSAYQRHRLPCDTAVGGREGVVGPLQRPTTLAFRRFCGDLVRRTGLAKRVVRSSVVEVRPARGPECGRRWLAVLATGGVVQARQVVWATNPRRRRLPERFQLSDSVVHSTEVELATVAAGHRIAVVGGGQTAGQLALEAARRGAVVTLVCRGTRRVADLDVDAGWLMDDHLTPFRSIADPAERRGVVDGVQHGSMTADLDRALDAASVCRVTEAGEVWAGPSTSGSGAMVGFAGVECEVDQVWAATGSVPDLRVDPALAALAAAGAPHVDGWPVLDDRLAWRDGFTVVGALAALTLGPSAGNLGGARAAAEVMATHAPLVERGAVACRVPPGRSAAGAGASASALRGSLG